MKYYVIYNYISKALAQTQPLAHSNTCTEEFESKEKVNKFVNELTQDFHLCSFRVIQGVELDVKIEKEEYQVTKTRDKVAGL